jgi:MATE family multidrug resistance protein
VSFSFLQLFNFIMPSSRDLSYLALINKAWPIMLAAASAPMLGIIDTAIIGRAGSVADLAGLAIVVALFNFLFWAFGFLRMGTTGLVATANDNAKLVGCLLCRNLILALALAFGLIALQGFLISAAHIFYRPPVQSVAAVEAYFNLRIWGAPATLCFYVLSGFLIGKGESKAILLLALALNSMNAVLDYLSAYVFNMGLQGVALGTIIAEYSCLLLAIFVVSRTHLDIRQLRSNLWQVFSWTETLVQLRLNRDILIRTFFLLLAFSWFTRLSASEGELALAANHILLQFISLSAFFLDGFAHVLEAKAGHYFARKNRRSFLQAFARTTYLSAVTAGLIGAALMVFGEYFFALVSDQDQVRDRTAELSIYAGVYIAMSFLAFQLDGLFIGLAQGSALRNASIIAALSFVALSSVLSNLCGVVGLWWAFIAYLVMRAVSLGYYYPRLMRQFA